MKQDRKNGIRSTTFNANGFGPISIAWNDNGISRVRFGKQGKVQKLSTKPSPVTELEHRLKAYFDQGRPIDLKGLPLDLTRFTPFQKAVWQATSQVPFGQTRSYSWVAARIKRPNAYRAVGTALGRNPFFLVVPCHRIVASGGGLGGFGGGLVLKKRLLTHERDSLL